MYPLTNHFSPYPMLILCLSILISWVHCYNLFPGFCISLAPGIHCYVTEYILWNINKKVLLPSLKILWWFTLMLNIKFMSLSVAYKPYVVLFLPDVVSYYFPIAPLCSRPSWLPWPPWNTVQAHFSFRAFISVRNSPWNIFLSVKFSSGGALSQNFPDYPLKKFSSLAQSLPLHDYTVSSSS